MLDDMWTESALFEEKSIFHTSEPRDTKIKVHLMLVFSCFVSALAIAIWFAEGGTRNFPVAAQKTMVFEEQNQWSDYGKSE